MTPSPPPHSHPCGATGANSTQAQDRLRSAEEVAELLAVPVRWVREATRDGRLPVVRLGRYCRYDLDDVRAWVSDQKSGGRVAEARKYALRVRTMGTK
jgi:excisionase family DNA binding protein